MPIRVAPSTTVIRDLVEAVDWGGLSMVWTGWDSSQWVLTDPTSGVYLKAGVRGLTMVASERYTSVSPALAGSLNRGSRTPEREVFWPVDVFSDVGSQAWLDYDAAFWRTMHPNKPGTWTVTQPNGTTRSLTCRFVDDGNQSFDYDPSTTGWQTYGITLVAEQPYWVGDPLTRTWSNKDQQDFFGGAGGNGFGPPFYISQGNTIASARLPNPGDADGYVVWRIDGPTTSVTVGVGDQTITYAAPIPANEYRLIDTNPDRRTVVDQDGNSRVADLGPVVSWAAVPSGDEVDLSLAMTGTGAVTATVQPRFFRAW